MPHFLTDPQFHTLVALCDTFIPGIDKADDPHGFWKRRASELEVPRLITRIVRDLQAPDQQAEFKLILESLSHSATALPLTGHAKPFTELSFAEREKVLQGWMVSPLPQIRQAFQVLKRLTCALFYSTTDEQGHNPNWPAIGYPGPYLPDGPRPPKRIQPLTIRAETILECDVVVVGSGAGGGVVAAELARAGKSVIVLEKGGYRSESEFDGRELSAYQHLYENQGVLATRDLGITVLAGATLGGGTVVNWNASFRTPDHVLDEWEHEYGCDGLTGRDYQDSLDAVCARLNVNTASAHPNPEAQRLEMGCQKLGYHIGPIPRNVQNCAPDCGWCTFGCASGGKQSTLRTYLQDAAEHGARFIVNAYCERVLVEQGRAVGVEAEVTTPEGIFDVQVRAKTVVIAAGAIHSPAILLRSHIANPNIGQNLRLHPTSSVFGRYDQPIDTWSGVMMSRYSTEFKNLDGKWYGVVLEHPPAHVGLIALGLPWLSAAAHKELLSKARYFAIIIALTRDRDAGRVVLDSRGQPRMHYKLSNHDGRHLMRGLGESFKIHAAAGAVEIGGMHAHLPLYQPTDSLDAHLKRFEAAGFTSNVLGVFSAHQMGTCRMGGQRSHSVVDPRGESWDVRGLYVADAATFPTSSGVNPMITIMANAHRIAQHLKTRLA